jgi:hypothetical protein
MNPAPQITYLESTIPPGMTIAQYRRNRPRRLGRWERLKELAGGAAVAAAAA